MAQQDVLDYIRKTPHNSNVNVVKGMLNSEGDGSGNCELFFAYVDVDLTGYSNSCSAGTYGLDTGDGYISEDYVVLPPGEITTVKLVVFKDGRTPLSITDRETWTYINDATLSGDIVADPDLNAYWISGNGTITIS